jgi:serine/threonine protein kinase
MARKRITLETAFGSYPVDEVLGEGAAGCVYAGIGPDGARIAAKVLKSNASTDRRRRFKNEVSFQERNRHANIVTVIDHGLAHGPDIEGPFCVMRRYDGSLRSLMRSGVQPSDVLRLFSQVLDGVEAAHLQSVIHRDLKPENILWDRQAQLLAIADFGIASFTEEQLATLVATSPAQRLANFLYAAPEQRTPGLRVATPADIYALGLILNEMFTRAVPHGTDYQQIADVAPDSGFLDEIVRQMLKQKPEERPRSIGEVKGLIQRYQAEAVTLQRLSTSTETVIPLGQVDEPLAHEPPRLVSIDWANGYLTLVLDRPVTEQWVAALSRMTGFRYLASKRPETFRFETNKAYIEALENEVQRIVDHFKEWLPLATATLRSILEEAASDADRERRERLSRKREAGEQRLRVLRQTRI